MDEKDLLKALLFAALAGEELENIIKKNNDKKVIGDKVKFIDKYHLNYFIDVETNKQLSEKHQIISESIIDLFQSQEMIVTETGIEKIYYCGHCSNGHIHDMVIFIPNMNKRYYVSSDSFALI